MVDDEVCGVFYSNNLVEEYIDLYKQDIRQCDEYSWEEFTQRGRKERIAESVFLPFAPLM